MLNLENPATKRYMRIMLITVGLLFGLIFAYKGFQKIMINRFLETLKSPVHTVSAVRVQFANWEPLAKATGNLRTVKGINITTELAGMIREIYFTPGAMVQKGDLLVQLDIDPDIAQLKALEATAQYQKITYERNKKQYRVGAISKEQLDQNEADYKSSAEHVKEQKATIAKKTIRAPFTGKLGISAVNLGQYLNPGDKIVSLQTLDPIYVDFYVPQEMLSKFGIKQTVTINIDTYGDTAFNGEVSTINPEVDKNTRNIEIEATIPNPDNKLLPGMFANVVVKTGAPKKRLTLPITAVTFNSYGDVIYVLKEIEKDTHNNSTWKAIETFITTGETRGDQITILTGLNENDMVVTSGQLKIKNGSLVKINNAVAPANSPKPTSNTE